MQESISKNIVEKESEEIILEPDSDRTITEEEMVLKQANPEGQLVSFPDANLRINQDFHKQLSLRKSLFKVRILKKKRLTTKKVQQMYSR